MSNQTLGFLISEIYPGLSHHNNSDQYFSKQNILACTNNNVMDLNTDLLKRFPGEEHMLLRADSVELDDEAINEYQPYPMEYLNSLVSSSLPLAHLALKVGCPVMLLWNLDPSKGLCNGTRLRVVQIRRRVLKCRIISGIKLNSTSKLWQIFVTTTICYIFFYTVNLL